MLNGSRVPDAEGATPAMAQWFAAKAAHPDALLFFRMGDFYELFFADAEAAAAALDIALTTRGEHNGQPIAMCGVPAHAADAYLLRLVRRGFRVAVAEQLEEAKGRAGKQPIRREVVRLVTPGTLTEDALLEATQPNRLVALVARGARVGAAWIDISTGDFATAEIEAAEVPALLARLEPAEILADEALPLGDHGARRGACPPPASTASARARLAQAFGAASLDAFGAFTDTEARSAWLALDYVRATQAGRLPHLLRPLPQGDAGRMAIDAATRASLEITRARDGGSAHTLRAVVDRTRTAAGARLLADWLAAPLTDPAAIAARQDGWRWLLETPRIAAELRTALRGAGDMARALARLSLGRGAPRDLGVLRDGLAAAACAALLEGTPPPALARARAALDPAPALRARLTAALHDPLPVRWEEGVIEAGFDPELDAERALRDDSRRVIASMELDYAQQFGVASLKIRHHAQLGYVIEAPASAGQKLRGFPDLVLRQGLANAARYTTTALADLDRRIAEASERAAARERQVFAALCAEALAQAAGLAACAAALAEVDVLQSCASLAESGLWCRPVVDDGRDFAVRAGRHPVVEAAAAGQGPFIPNDCLLPPERRVLLLTGPNMAGKSTFLRQNAIIAILAQAGLPVPAAEARLGVVDRLFSRVGAADDLARGRSTFMVEMTEAAAILHQAGPRSFVIVDEIGRGTSTLDGLAIAWAILEALHNTVRCRVIFATHFHELAALGGELPALAPHAMRVRQHRGEVIFLHEVAPGAAKRSWGVHVAQLAGLPPLVVKRAAALLQALEAQAGRLTDAGQLPLFAAAPDREADAEPEEAVADPLRAALAELEPDALSPRDALAELYRLRALASVASQKTRLRSG
jgi:DNA mismatch repair protein MutS